MNTTVSQIDDVGLGLRRSMFSEIQAEFTNKSFGDQITQVGFWEVAPENWMRLGGKFAKQFRELTERNRLFCHGLSLSLGGVEPLDIDFLKQLRLFLDTHRVEHYSEHLSYCSDDGHLYDLMPIPFTMESVDRVVSRIHQVQDILNRPLIIENVSAYLELGKELDEIEFVTEIVKKSGCELLLDVNNVYVNSVNHGFDAKQYITAIPSSSITYMHVAGHYQEADDLLIDTHGSDVIDEVWSLLTFTYQCHGIKPTLLERDFNIPPICTLLDEVQKVVSCQQAFTENEVVNAV